MILTIVVGVVVVGLLALAAGLVGDVQSRNRYGSEWFGATGAAGLAILIIAIAEGWRV